MITAWLSFSFLGLLIMALNMGSRPREQGAVAACVLVMADPVVAWIASWGNVYKGLFLLSPVSWTSMENLRAVSGAGRK